MSSITDLSSSALLSATGITIPRQADLTGALQAQWRAAFGAQVNLDPRSNNGQLINIMAERFALLYELVEAVYNASYPSGAEGVAVDNLLALQGLTRLPASATKTAASPVVQANGITLYGLVCYGTAGTLVPAGTQLTDGASPAHVFTTDQAITIGAAQNAVQTLVFSPAPTSGAYTLTLTAPSGTAYTTAAINFDANAQAIAGALIELGYGDATGNGLQPFYDVSVAQAGNLLTFSFGALPPQSAQQSTAGVAIPLIVATSTPGNPLTASSGLSNISVLNTVQGQPAQGVGSATCTETGTVSVTAGQLSNIQTPVAGLTAVVNQLDCVTGSEVETDAEALARRASLVANQASGPLAAILQRVEEVSGVTAVLAVANSSMASQQIITVGAAATAGSFALTVQGQTTGTVPFNTSAGALQAALRALAGFETASVAGTAASGLSVDWGTSVGGQGVALAQVANNTTGAPVTVQFGRYPKSIEVVVQGGSDSDVAAAIFATTPAGLATYGRPALVTTATTVAGQATITVADTTNLVAGLGVSCVGVPPGAQVASINGNSVGLTAVALSSGSNVTASFLHQVGVTDSSGNLQLVRFSRPQKVSLYVRAQLVTDTYSVPGDPTSGVNAASKWNVGNVLAIQQAIYDAVGAISIGGTISATGSGGVTNSFRSVPGIEDVTLYFGTSANTQNQTRLQLASEQVPDLQLQNIVVQFT